MIRCETQNQIAVLKMDDGKVNAIDVEFLYELNDHLDQLAKSDARAIILTASGSVFSAGVDLFRVLNGGASYLEKFLPLFSPVFEKFFLFPKPVIAATNGHAIAGGCILTCACDYRIMSQGDGRIGVPELLVGVPFPLIALEIMRFATPFPYLQQLIYTGATPTPEVALRMGLVDEVVAAEKLMERAQKMAQQLAAIPANSFRIVKRALRKEAVERTKANQQEIFESWQSPQIHAVIRNYLDKTIGKNR
jgi:Enoyl-CoA hydratase/carnithine racemase